MRWPAFVNRRSNSIATLKCLGASSRTVFGIYLTEITLVALIAIAIGLAAGAVAPMLAYGLLSAIIPLPIAARVEWLPLAIAGALGLLVTYAFAIWPLAHTRRVPASALFRHRILAIHGWPSLAELLAIAAALAGIGLIVFFSFEERRITGYFLGGLVASFVLLLGLARLIIIAAQRMPRSRSAIWRYAISNIYRPGSAAASVILALGLGLTLFVTLALTDRSISQELQSGLPEKAPAFFFLDVRNAELEDFKAAIAKEAGVTGVSNAPMLRGRMVSVKGVPAEKVEATPDSAWALRGDRGLTYSETLPKGSDPHRRRLVAGRLQRPAAGLAQRRDRAWYRRQYRRRDHRERAGPRHHREGREPPPGELAQPRHQFRHGLLAQHIEVGTAQPHRHGGDGGR